MFKSRAVHSNTNEPYKKKKKYLSSPSHGPHRGEKDSYTTCVGGVGGKEGGRYVSGGLSVCVCVCECRCG